ncbi:unnamed protein product [Dicrocoelium dendriticum]|nr:unnamed protein product [Dicrocoelium dendriticum]
MGLLFGIYLDYGTKTCEGFPGSMDYLETDAKSLAKWKVDYVKVDGCYSPEERMPLGYEDFGKYINQTGRPIVYSCSYPAYIGWQANHSLVEWERLKKNCNLWRMLSDVQDSWDSVMSIINVYKEHGSLLTSVAGPGHWNDPDMLVVGNYGLSKDQQRVQMGMWCMLAAPLILSVDLDNIDEFSAELLKNPHLLAINQDPGGHQAKLVKVKQEVMMWSRKLDSEPRTWAITFLYTVGGGGPIRVPTTLNEMALDGLNSTLDIYFTLTDVFDGSVFGKVKKAESFFVQVNPSGLAMYHVRGEERPRFEHLTLLGFVHIEANV